jgi:hypothetical protein
MHKSVIVFILFGLFLLSCETETDPVEEQIIEKDLNGYVQKGPFLNGTSITIHELKTNLTQTGKSYSAQILDNKGTFELRSVAFKSKYVELKADGFYFNEVKNENSAAPLILYALSDITDYSSLNVNVLSTLEKNRVQYLVEQGLKFEEAKTQALQEVLAIFSISIDSLGYSELLDISQPGDKNAALVAVSVILQGYLSVAELSELLANISTDIRLDGTLESETLKSQLINTALKLDLAAIRNNLEARYETLGMSVVVADFEKYVLNFITNSGYTPTEKIEYPVNGVFGPNVLNEENTEFCSGNYSMVAEVPDGFSLKVIMYSLKMGAIYPQPENSGWDYESMGMEGAMHKSLFTTNRTGLVEFKLYSTQSEAFAPASIEVYENEATEPSFTKTLSCGNGSGFDVPEYGLYGLNILYITDSVKMDTAETYSIAIHLPADKTYDVNLTFSFWEDSTFTIDESKIINWSYGMNSNLLELNATGSDLDFDLPIKFKGSGSISIDGGGLMVNGIYW